MATDTQLAIRIEARIRDAERNLARIEKRAAKAYGGMSSGAQRMATQVEGRMSRMTGSISTAFMGLGKSMAAGLVAGGVAGILGGIVTGVRDATSAIADLKSQAETAGVSFQAFQELKFAAEQSKVGVDALTDGLKEMQLRADEFIDTGKGSGAEAFAQLGFRAGDLAAQLEKPEELFTEIIDRLSQLDKASQIRIADEIFGGTGGEQFVRMLEDGRRGLEQARDRARELGVVISDEVVAEAERLDQRFNEIATTLSTTMKSATVTFADAAVAAFDRAREAAERYQRALNASEGGAAMGALADPNNRTAPSPEPEPSPGMTTPPGTPTPTPRPDPKRDLTFTPYKLPSSGGGSGGGSSAVSEAERQAEATRKVIEALEDEVLMLGMSQEAQRVYSEAKRAGVAAGSEEYAQIERLVGAYHDKRDAIEQAAEVQGMFTDMAMDGFYELAGAIDTGNAALDSMISRLIEAVAQAALLGKGPLAGIFGGGGGLFGGGGLGGLFGGASQLATAFGGGIGLYDKGGYTGPGGKYDPAGLVHKGEVVWSQRDVARAGGVGVVEAMRLGRRGYANGGIVPSMPTISAPRVPSIAPVAKAGPQSVNENVNITVDVRGAQGNAEIQAMVQAGVSKGLAGYDKRRRRQYEGGGQAY